MITSEQHPPSRAGTLRSAGFIALLAALGVGLYFLTTSGQPTPAQEKVAEGRKLAASGNMDQAAALWKQAAVSDPNCADAWAELGNYYQSVGDFDSAIDPYRHLAALKPDMPGVFGNLGGSVVQARDPKPVYAQALEDLKTKPNDPVALTIAVSYLTNRDEQRMQLTYLRRLTQLRPNDPLFLTTLAKTLVETHHYDEAGPVLERLVALAPGDPAGYDLRGQYLLKGVGTPQALAQAESDFLKTMQLNTRAKLPHLNLGRVYLRQRQPAKALEQLQIAAQGMPYRPDVYFELANAYTLAKQPGNAAQAQAKFLALRRKADRITDLTKREAAFPDDIEIHLELARLQMEQGELDKAATSLERAIALRPDDMRVKALARQYTALTGSAEGRP